MADDLKAAIKQTTDVTEARLAEAVEIGISFLRTELSTGRTFAALALDAHTDDEKRERNRRQAETAVETVAKFMSRLSLTPAETQELSNELAKLRSMIQAIPPTPG